jgi:hypothetical protein
MKALYNFIVEPLGDRYTNKKNISGSELILNTELHNHSYSNRIAKVLAVPSEVTTEIKEGDEIIVHHNVFRRFKDIRGNEKNSRSYYNENTYFVSLDQVFGYRKTNEPFKACKGFNFIKPIMEDNMFSNNFEKEGVGVLVYKDPELNSLENGSLVGFKPGAEYEFIIGKDRLYRVPTKSITIKYEYQGNEKEYNPSWT